MAIINTPAAKIPRLNRPDPVRRGPEGGEWRIGRSAAVEPFFSPLKKALQQNRQPAVVRLGPPRTDVPDNRQAAFRAAPLLAPRRRCGYS